MFSENFIDLFKNYHSDIFLHENPTEDPFMNLIKKNFEIININKESYESYLNKQVENILTPSNIDEIFFFYLKEFYNQTNPEYFHFMFKFIIMFRQCINKFKKESSFNPPDPKNYFTQNNNAETIPDLCNDFFTDFLEPKDYYGMEVMELIDVIQHLCNWLFINKYTTSRLTLV